jgi:cell division protein FtsB
LYRTVFERIARRKSLLLAIAALVACTWAAVAGPRGLRTLFDKQAEIRRLQEENAEIERENARRRDRIHRLEENRNEQEIEIRKNLKKVRPGETTFILPEGAPQAEPEPPAEAK